MSSLDQHAGVIALVALCAAGALAIWLVRVAAGARRTQARMDEILGGISGNNVASMLVEYLGTVRSTAAAMQQMQQEHARIAQIMPSVVRHVGLVRFSPFHDTGGDQSFALALLDAQGDGVVVTGLHSRTDSRLYAKPISRGSSPYSLTPEERQAMDQAFQPGVVEAQETPSR